MNYSGPYMPSLRKMGDTTCITACGIAARNPEDMYVMLVTGRLKIEKTIRSANSSTLGSERPQNMRGLDR